MVRFLVWRACKLTHASTYHVQETNTTYAIYSLRLLLVYPLSFAQSFRRNNNVVGHGKKEKLLFYIFKVKCMCNEKFMIPFQKQQKKERGKLIRDTLKKNTCKLIEDGG